MTEYPIPEQVGGKICQLCEPRMEKIAGLLAEVAQLKAQVQQLREALKSAAPVINCLDVYGRYLPVKYLIADTLAASEPK